MVLAIFIYSSKFQTIMNPLHRNSSCKCWIPLGLASPLALGEENCISQKVTKPHLPKSNWQQLCRCIYYMHVTSKIKMLWFHGNQDVGMAVVYKLHIQGGSDNTMPFPLNHPYISTCMLQPAQMSTAATYVGMVMWEWCCVIFTRLYVYFVDQCYHYILLISTNSLLYFFHLQSLLLTASPISAT